MELEIIIIAVTVSIACSIWGVFLLLRRMSLMSDAISHSIILGIVLGYFISRSLSSTIPLIGAVISGLLSAVLTEALKRTRLVKSDAAIGLVFPAMFSLGVILVSLYAGNVHLDVDSVLLGEIGLAPLDRIQIANISLPRNLVIMLTILIINLILVILFFKELKLTTFDPSLAKSLGYSPTWINYGLMLMVSITCVGAFDSVGAVLVTALMIAPAAAALLLTDSLFIMLIISGILASVSAVSGFFVALKIDASISGAMATMTGIIFLLAYLFSPKQGLIKRKMLANKLKIDFAVTTLLVHLFTHEGTEKECDECCEEHLTEHINWSKEKAKKIVKIAVERKLIGINENSLSLSDLGRELAKKSITEI
ncbi:MAG: zinc ABC transporter permease [Treponema sp.]|nr:MAG: zinc ABC transporter permease [Treponema sp.]